MAIEFTIEGGPELIAKLTEMGVKGNQIAATAIFQQAEAIMAESKARFVPVDTGVLRASGFVSPPRITSEGIEIQMGYGGAAEAYAVEQHENLTYRHTVGGPKYLERPLMEAARNVGAKVAQAFKAWG